MTWILGAWFLLAVLPGWSICLAWMLHRLLTLSCTLSWPPWRTVMPPRHTVSFPCCCASLHAVCLACCTIVYVQNTMTLKDWLATVMWEPATATAKKKGKPHKAGSKGRAGKDDWQSSDGEEDDDGEEESEEDEEDDEKQLEAKQQEEKQEEQEEEKEVRLQGAVCMFGGAPLVQVWVSQRQQHQGVPCWHGWPKCGAAQSG